MQSRKTVKWSVLVLLLVLMMAAASPGTPFAQEPQFEPMVPCGDSASCSMPTEAFSVENSGTGAAIYGYNTSGVSGAGVYGRGTAGAGVRGQSQSGNGVFGASYNTAGVRGRSTWGVGVRAESVRNAGVWAKGYALGPDLILVGDDNAELSQGVISSDPAYTSSDLYFFSNDEFRIYLDENDDEEAEFFAIYNGSLTRILEAQDDGDLIVYDDLHLGANGSWTVELLATWADEQDLMLRANDNIQVDLDNDNDDDSCFYIRDGANDVIWLACEAVGTIGVGSQAAAVETNSGSRAMYAMGSPELWFEDFGSAQLVDGAAVVNIDALFLETVNTDLVYHVYLTPLDDCNGLYVANKTATSFEVHELGGGTSGISFDYRIVAKRLDYENQRLEQVDLTAPVEAEP